MCAGGASQGQEGGWQAQEEEAGQCSGIYKCGGGASTFDPSCCYEAISVDSLIWLESHWNVGGIIGIRVSLLFSP